jgi:hypothetical protein
MARQNVEATDSLNEGRDKINNNFIELYNATKVDIAGATVLDNTAFDKVHVCSGTTADYSITLPSAVGNTGRVIIIKGSPDSAILNKAVTIDGAGTELVDGYLTKAISTGGYATLMAIETTGVGSWVALNFEQGAPILFTISLTGYSVAPTYDASYYYIKGKVADFFLRASAHGTSNATTLTWTLPAGLIGAFIQRLSAHFIVDNGAQVSNFGQVQVASGSGVVSIFTSPTGGAWTASNGKSFGGNFRIAIR